MKHPAHQVRELLDYDPETGLLTWRERKLRAGYECYDRSWNTQWAGRVTGTLEKKTGYLRITIYGKQYFAHNVIWVWMTGKWPDSLTDHEDTNKANNRWSNLRLATPMQNNANVGLIASNKSGFKGVHWNKARRKWEAAIQINRSHKTLGRFDTAEVAHAAYMAAAIKAFGEFARAS